MRKASPNPGGTAPVSDASETLDVRGRRIRVSNLDKVFYPKSGFTKGEVLDYYIRVSPVLLPHLKDRPLTLKRYPDGVAGAYFYEKRCPAYRPDWIRTVPVPSERTGGEIHYCLANDLPSVLWAANLGDLELHTSLAKAGRLDRPTMVMFDLDPGAPAGILNCAQCALWLRDKLEALGLKAFPKTSGSKGLQVCVPLNVPVNFETTKSFARSMAETLERDHPDRVVSRMAKSLRAGRVFVDWSQNDRHKTTVCVYSLRAREEPAVSAPVSWAEVLGAWKKQDSLRLLFLTDEVLHRVRRSGDLFKPVLKMKQKLPRRVEG